MIELTTTSRDLCPLCLTELDKEECIKHLECGHSIHMNCFESCIEHGYDRCSMCQEPVHATLINNPALSPRINSVKLCCIMCMFTLIFTSFIVFFAFIINNIGFVELVVILTLMFTFLFLFTRLMIVLSNTLCYQHRHNSANRMT